MGTRNQGESKEEMSYSKFERGNYIKGRIMDIALHEAPLKPEGDGLAMFEDAFNLQHDISTAGNPKTEWSANHPLYLRALDNWQKYREGSPHA